MARRRQRTLAAAEDKRATVAVVEAVEAAAAVAAHLLKSLEAVAVLARCRLCIRRAGSLAAAVEAWSERRRSCKIARRG